MIQKTASGPFVKVLQKQSLMNKLNKEYVINIWAHFLFKRFFAKLNAYKSPSAIIIQFINKGLKITKKL
jgi:hypothetical protein